MNTSKSKSFVLRCGAAAGFAWCMTAAMGALAQEAAQKPDQAVQKPAESVSIQKQAELTPITGSHIRRVRTTDASLPLVELDRAYIERSGATTPSELIRTVPQVQNR